MTYKSILVNFNIDEAASPLLELAINLATQFNAHLIGFAAANVMPIIAGPDGLGGGGEVMMLQREDIEKRLKQLSREFERVARSLPSHEWRDGVASPTLSLIEAARTADLIITSAAKESFITDGNRSANLPSLVLQAGRPVLVSAHGMKKLFSNTALVAWKDTREARRAVIDAIPLLCQAGEVVVVTVDGTGDALVRESLQDVLALLLRHGIRARSQVIDDNDDGSALLAFARSVEAELIVSGAYGHSRVREFIFGGVTRSLLEENGITRLMSS
ncbi:universal stress protein [Phyllobacterium sp. P30BS-XVII]|uniref:universal stress protein n=1 Tax=Phyllobacterium sp. P30BS-XVII TaxID=2587046 RepID=UPI000DDF18CA|nr:universal stress protein [Phyllobacterium sp. P30BS-XVII]MBA8903144.1 nucleotide-binding universal stress UspA family protein [Phyllobacterium sp. P30BS-XVII]